MNAVKPFQRTMHFSVKQPGTWDGMGADLEAACGQSEYIAVTSTVEAVDCMKCQAKIEKEAISE